MAEKQAIATASQQGAALIVNNKFIDELSKQLRQKEEYGLSFPADYNPTNALMGAYLQLKETNDKNGKCVLETCSQASIANCLMDMVTKGLNMLYGPGNDLVSATAMTAAGAHLILFSTGRGTPFSAPAPTLKISTNTPLAEKKSGWIDFNTGVIADGEKTIDEAAKDLLDLVIRVASGEQTKAEKHGFREISIFKDGVVL